MSEVSILSWLFFFMAYVYRHIRLDKNEVFYIGIGSDEKYKRAYSKNNRNTHWHNICKFGYEVEIVLDELTWEDACLKEIEFIKLYGRKDLNEGTLVNMTDGGDGSLGYITTEETRKKRSHIAKNMSEETRKKMSDARLGRKLSEEHRKKISDAKKNMSEETRKKIGKARLGRKFSEETRKKMSDANLGKKLSEETRKKMSDAKKNMSEEHRKKLSDAKKQYYKNTRRGLPYREAPSYTNN